MLRMTDVGMKDVPVGFVAAAAELGSWLLAGMALAFADMLCRTYNDTSTVNFYQQFYMPKVQAILRNVTRG